MATDGRGSVRLTIPAKPEYITLGRLALTALSRVRPISEEALSDLKLALTEACTNSVRHAYDDGREGLVEIVYTLRPDRLVIEVADDGDGFDPNLATAFDDDELSEGGLGIAIIRAVTDEVELEERQSGGLRLRFAKFVAD